MPAITDKSRRGLSILSELLGKPAAAAAEERVESGELGAPLTRIGLDFAFEEIWGRPGLDRRSRSLVTLGVLIASHALQELRNHLHIAIRNGLTAKELEETIIQSLPYAGFPAASPAMSELIKVLRELKQDCGAQTIEERRLL